MAAIGPARFGGMADALQMPDHRRLYLDYEGPVSGGRGSVTRWDGGTFEWEASERDQFAVRLCGGRLQGVFRLERLEGDNCAASFGQRY